MSKSKAATSNPDDFFADINTDEDLKSFVDHMGQPREEIPQLPGFDGEGIGPIGGGGEDGEPGEGLSPDERDIVQYFDFTDEHRMTAEIGLIWIDRLMALIASLITGKNAEAYRTREGKPDKDDYEIQLAAALVKKYQMRMSLEWAFMLAMGMRYGPVVASIPGDVKKAKIAKDKANQN